MDFWDIAFANLCSWRLHPGYLRDGAQAPSLEEIARMCNEMVRVREELKVWP